MYAFIKISTLIMLMVASVLLVGWLYRPGSKTKYLKFSKIALKDEGSAIIEERRSGGRE
jgi:cbb3-type cytochrome oxidase subunit 3